ncbi:MAG: hypothetical protein OHK0029_27770 [Armatimonadaceae bacterium]
MRKLRTHVFSAMVLLPLVSALSGLPAAAQDSPLKPSAEDVTVSPGITVRGVATVQQPGDIAYIRFTVSAETTVSSGDQLAVNEAVIAAVEPKMEKVIQALVELGIAREKIVTQNRPGNFGGSLIANSVEAKTDRYFGEITVSTSITDLKTLRKVLEGGVKAGAKPEVLVQYDLSDAAVAEARKKAYKAALNDANEKAKELAVAAGVESVLPIGVREDSVRIQQLGRNGLFLPEYSPSFSAFSGTQVIHVNKENTSYAPATIPATVSLWARYEVNFPTLKVGAGSTK